MALWRIGDTWPESTMRRCLADLTDRRVSFDTAPEEMDEAHGWTVDGSDSVLGSEAPGPPAPDGVFERARQAILNYDFSDPAIVDGHFDPNTPFIGRNMLLEIKVPLLRLHYLGGVRVHSLKEVSNDEQTVFGFRYDTLEGHIEKGLEWFLLTKDHNTGEVRFRIEARWRLGQFPNWWSKLGFRLIGARCRDIWRDRAPARLREAIRRPTAGPRGRGGSSGSPLRRDTPTDEARLAGASRALSGVGMAGDLASNEGQT